MASKPTVTLTLAGDEKKLTDSFANTTAAGDKMVSSVEQDSAKLSSAFDKVGSASKQMGDKVSSTSRDFEDVSKSAEDYAEVSDTVDTRAMGFRDTITGVSDSLKGITDPSLSAEERLLTLGMGVGDLASGFTNLIIPALSSFGSKIAATAAGQWALNAAQTAWNGITIAGAAAMRLLNAAFVASPIGWIVLGIGAVVTAFTLLWNKSAAFRDFFIGMWNGIKSTVGGVVGWIKDAWEGVVGFFTGLPGRIGGALGSLASVAKNAFKGAVNTVVDALNWFLDNTINWLINRVNDISGVIGIPPIPTIPHIPRMHAGGVVPGLPGQESLMLVAGGERVSTSGQGGGGRLIVSGDLDSALARLIMKLVNDGDIRLEAS